MPAKTAIATALALSTSALAGTEFEAVVLDGFTDLVIVLGAWSAP